ncbi:hypothetical protein HanPI659440_Chr03g0104621 [Helianthus annuus]|nr:hypothetical protein HanPI659440_Chr03g0104621 [Helianthus annuus]
MCEICGGPYFTVNCPQYEGSSARCYANPFMCQNCGIPHISIFCPYFPRYSTRYANPFVQSQRYFSQGYSLNYYDNQPYYDDPYQQPQHNQGQTSDRGSGGSLSRMEEMFAQMMTQNAQMMTQNEATQKSLAVFAKTQEQINRNRESALSDQQSALLDLQRTVDDIARRLKEEEQAQKVQPEQPTTGYTYEDWSDEEITSVTEMKMDDEVPPPVPQVPIINYWSDSDDEIDEEEWAAYQRSLVKKEVIEEEVELGDSTGWMFDEVEKEKVMEEEVDLGDSLGLMFGAEEEIEEVEIKSSGEDE